MKNFELIYASRAKKKFDTEQILKLATESASNNAKFGVTGLLIHHENYFIQLLEGDQFILNGLYLRICQDRRHFDCRLLSYDAISQKSFRNWSMELILASGGLIKEKFRDYFPDSFSPFSLSPDNSKKLMRDFAEYKKEKNELAYS